MLKYSLWNIGCQMNRAESDRFADHMDSLGWMRVPRPEEADLVLLNTCVVRGSAEDKVSGHLSYLKGLKARSPHMAIAVTGCFVEGRPEDMKDRFPHVELFFPAGDFDSFSEWASRKEGVSPNSSRAPGFGSTSPVARVPIIRGCNNFCAYCIVPYRRGRERSRPPEDLLNEVQSLVRRGVKEVTLLGQNVNSYGRDLEGGTDLAGLLAGLSDIRGVERIRFLTSHPRDVDRWFAIAVAKLDKVCEWISLPVQAGDDRILGAMRRCYTVEQYREVVNDLRSEVPGIAISTDVIVGFPTETEIEFGHTMDMLSELRFDTVHVAAYSPRPGTLAAGTMPDDVPPAEKKRRLDAVEALQESIAFDLNQRLKGSVVEVLVERSNKGKWEGRTRSNKIVFISDHADLVGRVVKAEITSASPWALQGRLVLKAEVGAR